MNIPSHNAKILEMQLRKILEGIEKNSQDWPQNNQTSKESFFEICNELSKKIEEIQQYEENLSDLRKKLSKYVNESAKSLYKRARDQAYSIYGKNSDKLEDYSLKKI